MKLTIMVLALGLVVSQAAQAQIWYDGQGNRHDFNQGTVESNPMFGSPPSSSFSVPAMPQVPDVSRGIGAGPGPYGTALPSGPSGYPCTMPGCR